VPSAELPFQQPSALDRKQIDCVEIYLPKSIEFLSELYQMLREKVQHRLGLLVLDGFSVYEADGVFRGEKTLWEQRTLVIRILFIRKESAPATSLDTIIGELGREIATKVAVGEEQIWICHYAQNLRIFEGLKRLLS
jgi:hypothetical protein